MKKILILIIFGLIHFHSSAQVSGTVYLEKPYDGTTYNTYGNKDTNEQGVGGVTVTVYPGGLTATTAANGTYTIAGAPAGGVRVEFSGWPSPLESSSAGNSENTSVQFVTAPSANVDYGLHNIVDYYAEFPFVSSVVLHGDTYNHATNGNADNIVIWQKRWGVTAPNGQNLVDNQIDENSVNAPPDTIAEKQEVGSVLGLVFDKKRNKIYSSSFLKLHTDFGPNGGSAIYQVPVNGITGEATGTPTLLLNIASADALGAHARVDIGTGTYDNTVQNLVGKSSFGDLEISEDYDYLYVTNLATREIHEIDLSTNTVSRTFAVPTTDGGGGGNCPSTDDIRPFGLGMKDGRLYVGMICSCESLPFDPRFRSDGYTADYWSEHPRWQMMAYIYSLDLSVGVPAFSKELDWDLDGRDHTAVPPNHDANDNLVPYSANRGGRSGWMPWEPNWAALRDGINAELGSYNQGDVDSRPVIAFGTPMLSDIVFYGEDMTVAFRDRTADQWGNGTINDLQAPPDPKEAISKGDIYLIYKSGGVWNLENGVNGGARTSSNCDTNPGGYRNYCEGCAGDTPAVAPDNKPGNVEWYWSDGTNACDGNHQGGGHRENSFGMLAQFPGGELLTTQMNPPIPIGQNVISSGGIVYLDQSDATPLREYMLYKAGQSPNTFSKSNGLGDIEVVSSSPIEIGNLVWVDTDSDGIQDANEAGIAGVEVKLFEGATLIATSTTDANGNYIFSNNPEITSTGSHIYNISELKENTAFKVVIENISGGSKQGNLGTNTLTSNDVGEGANTDINDSDGVAVGANAEKTVAATDIQKVGANNHTFDFGFAPPPACNILITSATNSACVPSTNTYELAVTVSYTDGPGGNITISTDNGQSQSFVSTGTSPETFTITGITADGTMNIDVTAVFDGDAACSVTSSNAYDAPIDCTPACPTTCGSVTVVKN